MTGRNGPFESKRACRCPGSAPDGTEWRAGNWPTGISTISRGGCPGLHACCRRLGGSTESAGKTHYAGTAAGPQRLPLLRTRSVAPCEPSPGTKPNKTVSLRRVTAEVCENRRFSAIPILGEHQAAIACLLGLDSPVPAEYPVPAHWAGTGYSAGLRSQIQAPTAGFGNPRERWGAPRCHTENRCVASGCT